MKIVNSRKRKAISPVLATVILIAITLIAAVAIATFVFGIFGTSASPAQMSIQSSSIVCPTTATCHMTVINGGTVAGSINGAGPATGTVKFSLTNGTAWTVPANGQVRIDLAVTGGTSGQTVQGYLTQSNGPNLAFSTILS